MRTTKTISVSLPPKRPKEMERVARRQSRTSSDLVRDRDGALPATLAEALGWVREDAKRKGVRLTQREINAEIAAARRQPTREKRKQAVR